MNNDAHQNTVTGSSYTSENSEISSNFKTSEVSGYILSITSNEIPLVILKMDKVYPLNITQRKMLQEDLDLEAVHTNSMIEGLIPATIRMSLNDDIVYLPSEDVVTELELMETENSGQVTQTASTQNVHDDTDFHAAVAFTKTGRSRSVRPYETFDSKQLCSLEAYFRAQKYWSSYQYSQMAKQLNVDPLKVRAWFARKRRMYRKIH